MPLIGNQKDERMIEGAAMLGVGALLVFGTIPVLNIAIGTPIVAGLTAGTFLGAVALYVGYRLVMNK